MVLNEDSELIWQLFCCVATGYGACSIITLPCLHCQDVLGTKTFDSFLLSVCPPFHGHYVLWSSWEPRKPFDPKTFSLFSTDLWLFFDRKTNESMMWMWHQDIKWLEVVNQTLIKSVWPGLVHLPWVQNWPDLGDFPDRPVYHWGCSCTVAHFMPLKPFVGTLYFKGTVFLIALKGLGENFQL